MEQVFGLFCVLYGATLTTMGLLAYFEHLSRDDERQ